MSFEQIRYSTVWEDPELLKEGLAVRPGDRLLSIGSAGCNILALLLNEPASVTAIDMSASQLALVELKLKGIENLEFEDFCCLMNIHGSPKAVDVFHHLENHLSESCRSYWKDRLVEIRNGIGQSGRLEKYFSKFRDEYISKKWNDLFFNKLFMAKDIEEQKELLLDLPELKPRMIEYFSREGLEREGRDPAQFKYVTRTEVGAHFYSKFEKLLNRSMISQNHYLQHFLAGRYGAYESNPCYLQRENFRRLKNLVLRVHLVHNDLELFLTNCPPASFDKANLSDVFEYMSEDHAREVFKLLARALRPRGRLAYWTLLVPRTPQHIPELTYLESISKELHERDRLWFYDSFNVFEVAAEKL